MFITPAYAQMPGGGSDPFTGLLIPMLVMVLIFYFLVIRPQQQRAKEHRELVNQVRRGDTVITSGGFIGKVTKASDNSDEVEVELSDSHARARPEVDADRCARQGRARRKRRREALPRRPSAKPQTRSVDRCCTSNAGRSSPSC